MSVEHTPNPHRAGRLGLAFSAGLVFAAGLVLSGMTQPLKVMGFLDITAITKGPFPVTGATQKVSTRLRGRELAIQIQSSTSSNVPWRMGQFRMAIEPDGLR